MIKLASFTTDGCTKSNHPQNAKPVKCSRHNTCHAAHHACARQPKACPTSHRTCAHGKSTTSLTNVYPVGRQQDGFLTGMEYVGISFHLNSITRVTSLGNWIGLLLHADAIAYCSWSPWFKPRQRLSNLMYLIITIKSLWNII